MGVDVSIERSGSNEEVYTCERLETEEFEPSAEYLAQSMGLRTVRAFVNRSRVRGKSVYMVTGVKIAKGAGIESSRGRRVDVGFKGGVDGSGVGVPVGGGPEVKVGRELSTGLSVGRSDDFVLAYKVVKVSVKRDGRIVDREFNKWALMDGYGGGKGNEWEIEDLDVVDFEAENTTRVSDVSDGYGETYDVVLGKQ